MKKTNFFTMLVHFFYFHEFNVQRRILFEHAFNVFQSRILLQNINWRNVQYSVCIISFHYIHAEVQRLTSDSFIQQQFYFKQVLNHQRCIQLYNHDNKTISKGEWTNIKVSALRFQWWILNWILKPLRCCPCD